VRRLDDIDQAIRAAGFSSRGFVALEPREIAGLTSVVLVGMVGMRNWGAFAASPEYADGLADPLDRWSERVLGGLARALDATALYPFRGPPYAPFQRWALRAEPVAPSPLGLLIHPEYGLWHSYRGALGFAEALEAAPFEAQPSPCASCAERPCLSGCPVGAFDGRTFEVETCAAHVRSAAGVSCRDDGCRARRACPVGQEHAQTPEAAAFHMRAFLASR